MLQAKDIMKKDVVAVRPDTPVLEALELMLENEISGLPVVKQDMSLVGIITEKDLFHLFYEPQAATEKKTKEFMTKSVQHFDENENLEVIFKCLAEVHFRRVPVTKDGKVIGIVSRPDVLRCILSLSSEVFSHKY